MHDDGHNLLSRTSPIHAMLLLLFGTTKAKIKARFPGASAWRNGISARFEPASHGGKRGASSAQARRRGMALCWTDVAHDEKALDRRLKTSSNLGLPQTIN